VRALLLNCLSMLHKSLILVIEDDSLTRQLIADVFENDPYQLRLTATGAEGLSAYDEEPPDLVICDIHLPDLLGLDICRRIKQSNPAQLFVFLTGASGTTDQVVGLELGADDYITKPLRIEIFRARVRALLRRLEVLRTNSNVVKELSSAAKSGHQRLSFGALTLDLTAYQAFLNDTSVTLTHKEFELLAWLAAHPGQLFTRQHLLDQVWHDNLEVSERSVDALIRRLRDKLGEDGENPRYIETVRGMGYRFKAE
jgi:two-component system, OmpR family, alkaline phosphatase synthesis response regulator PhoP